MFFLAQSQDELYNIISDFEAKEYPREALFDITRDEDLMTCMIAHKQACLIGEFELLKSELLCRIHLDPSLTLKYAAMCSTMGCKPF